MKTKLLLSLLMLVIIVAGSVLLEQEFFRVRAVVVRGCETRPPEEVTALTALEYDQSIFKVDIAAIRANVDRSPYYRVDAVNRLYPDQVEVVVHERQPKAAVQYIGSYLIMDEDGYILEIRQDKGYAQCPTVTGLNIVSYNVGQQVNTADALQLRAMNALLTALEQQDAARLINEISLENALDIHMNTVDGYRVAVGDTADLDAKISWLHATLAGLSRDGLYGGVIYLGANNASYMPSGVGSQANAADAGIWPADAWPDGSLPDDSRADEPVSAQVSTDDGDGGTSGEMPEEE